MSFSNFYTLAKSLSDGTAQRSSDSASRLFWLTQIHRDSNANASHLLSPYFWAITLDNKLAKRERKKYQHIAFCCFFLLSWIVPNCKNLISLRSLHSGDPTVAPSVGCSGKARCACDVFVCFLSLESKISLMPISGGAPPDLEHAPTPCRQRHTLHMPSTALQLCYTLCTYVDMLQRDILSNYLLAQDPVLRETIAGENLGYE